MFHAPSVMEILSIFTILYQKTGFMKPSKTCTTHGFNMFQSWENHAPIEIQIPENGDSYAIRGFSTLLHDVNNWSKYTCKKVLKGYNSIKFNKDKHVPWRTGLNFA